MVIHSISSKSNLKRVAQLLVVLGAAFTLKQYYSTAGVNQLRWILAPTTAIVEAITGSRFVFESNSGYINAERTFVIAASCSGVNFLLTAFLMLALRKLWIDRLRNISWSFFPVAVIVAYSATLIANTVRISTALKLQRTPLEISWLSGNQLHRLEGIFIYFGFLLLLFLVNETINGSGGKDGKRGATMQNGFGKSRVLILLKQSFFPVLIYYATTLGIPLVTAVYRPGAVPADFRDHFAFVLLTPLLLLAPLVVFRLTGGWIISHEHRKSSK